MWVREKHRNLLVFLASLAANTPTLSLTISETRQLREALAQADREDSYHKGCRIRTELTNVVRRRYCAAAGAEKRRIRDEFIAVTGYHHKSAIRALNAEPIVKRRQ